MATRDDFLHYYREMAVIRTMEENARDLYREKKIRGFLHLCIGQVREMNEERELCCILGGGAGGGRGGAFVWSPSFQAFCFL